MFDLFLGDVIGVFVYNLVDCEFEFKCGVVFVYIVIVDEINCLLLKM